MNNGLKFGYFLLGTGVGMFAACLYFERELNKPIGEIEEYIPKSENKTSEDEENEEENEDLVTGNEMAEKIGDVLGYTSPNKADLEDIRKKEFEKFRSPSNKNQSTRYSKMYNDGGMNHTRSETEIVDMLEAQRKANEDYISRMKKKAKEKRNRVDEVEYDAYGNPTDDIPYEDDVVAADNDLVRERVENDFEIYLDDNPQDFVTLIFYEGDNTLCDDREHVVPAADEVVGHVALSRLIEGGPGADDGVIFVRNLKTMINYEVVLDAGSYSETVLGIFNSRSRPNKGADGSGDSQ